MRNHLSKKQKFLLFIFLIITILGLTIAVKKALILKEAAKKEEIIYVINLTKFNHFRQKEDLFAFDYKNNYEVLKNREIYYLRELKTKNIAFQIFENRPKLSFDKAKYICEKPSKKSEICYSKETTPNIIQNIEIHPKPDHESRKYRILTRAETLKIIFSLRYPEVNYERYRRNCFNDVTRDHPLSGYICYAKEKGTIVGIEKSFYPDSSVNLWGFLKILFSEFNFTDFTVPENTLDKKIFALMTPYHFAYPAISKAYFEGFFLNIHGKDVWPNRHLYLDEAVEIATNFLNWKNGKKLRDYATTDNFKLESEIFYREQLKELKFSEKDVEDFKLQNERKAKLIDSKLYIEEDGGILEYVYSFEISEDNDNKNAENIAKVTVDYDEEKFALAFLVEYKNEKKEHFKLAVKQDDFSYLKTEVKNTLEDPNLLPNPAKQPDSNIPHLKIYLDHDDFKSLLIDRTITSRYPAYLEIFYPDGTVESHSILIKTRGNANRGYIKSSFTVETFKNINANKNFAKDDFLKNTNEFKLRSMIGDQSMIKEKLIYQTYKDIGHIAPDFFEVTMEVNNLPFGLYQITEAIKKDFFQNHGVKTENYYYAQNITSPYLANLSDPKDIGIIKAHYEMHGDEEKLLDLIRRLDKNDKTLLKEIDIQNVFDYTMLTYLTAANDSITHNYYIYFDDNIEKWRFFPWDADAGFEIVLQLRKNYFSNYALKSSGTYNKLILFVFKNLSTKDFNRYFKDISKRWKTDVNLVGQIDTYLKEYEKLFIFDNQLWHGRYLEEKIHSFDTIKAIKELRKKAVKIGK
ncbi:CotH kinase family protein [Candidatus Peregrinibacteria bacterium]|nr:CotH kinase family protein [Candidatus Peregrinibacteria bacterium]